MGSMITNEKKKKIINCIIVQYGIPGGVPVTSNLVVSSTSQLRLASSSLSEPVKDAITADPWVPSLTVAVAGSPFISGSYK